MKKESGSSLFSDMNNDWDTDRFNAVHLTTSVISIHICGYVNTKNVGDEDGNPLDGPACVQSEAGACDAGRPGERGTAAD